MSKLFRLSTSSFLCLLISCPLVLAQSESQTFDSAASSEAAGWTFNDEGQSTERFDENEVQDNRCSEDAPCETNLGWKSSNFAGGVDAGEGGGLVHRSGGLPVGFYADTTIGELNLDMPITASGKVSLVNMNANGHYHFGFFDGQRVLADPFDAGAELGFFFGEPGGDVRPNFRWGHKIQTDSGSNDGNHNGFVEGAEPDVPLDFTISYDPTGDGLLSLAIGDDDPVEVDVPPELREESTTLTAFGIWTATSPGNAGPNYMEIFLDDVTYTSLAVETLPGDFNSSGELDAGDIDLLNAQIAGAGDSSFDLNGDGAVDGTDRNVWVKELKKTWFGDSNLDGEFNSGDFVQVFGAGKYEDGILGNATWAEGDWDGNGDFDSGDLVAAFTDGGFESGPLPAATVPEPSSVCMLLIGTCVLGFRRSVRTND